MTEIAITVESLTVKYTPQCPALLDVSLRIPRNDYLGIIGPNGGGKSTLMKAILGLIPIRSGSITVAPCSKLAYVPQFSTMERLFPITAMEVVLSAFLGRGGRPFSRFSAEQRDKAMAYIEKTGIKGLENRLVGELSGGECQKLLLARALAAEPDILFLDEPASSIDPVSRERVYGMLDSLQGKMTIIMITHDEMALHTDVKNVAYLNEMLLYHGPKTGLESLSWKSGGTAVHGNAPTQGSSLVHGDCEKGGAHGVRL